MSKVSTREWLYSQNSSNPDGESQFTERVKKSFTDKAKTISISSGKGGVGKTTTAVTMARKLADAGKRTLLIDCDFNLSNTSLKLGLPINNNFSKWVRNECSIDDCIYTDGLFNLMSACNGDLEIFETGDGLEKYIIDLIIKLENKYDFILLDCPAGIEKGTMSLCAYSDYRLIMVTPEKSSITDSYSLIKVLNKKYGIKNFSLVLNKISNLSQSKRIIRSVCETADHFLGATVSYLGRVSYLKDDVDNLDHITEKNSDHKINKEISKIAQAFVDEDIKVVSKLGLDRLKNSIHGPQEVGTLIS